MRTNEEKIAIVDSFSPEFSLEGVLTDEDINQLLSTYRESKNKIHKNTGPVTMNLTADILNSEPIKKVMSEVRRNVGEFGFLSGFFFEVDRPHVIHNDDSYEFPQTFKGITIPLSVERDAPSTEYPKLCFFDQYYLNGPAKFLKGHEGAESYYNSIVYDYQDVQSLTSVSFPEEVRQSLFPHLRPSFLDGLSLLSSLESKPGNVLVFDAVRLHAASDFRTIGIKSKIGISIFTKKQ